MTATVALLKTARARRRSECASMKGGFTKSVTDVHALSQPLSRSLTEGRMLLPSLSPSSSSGCDDNNAESLAVRSLLSLSLWQSRLQRNFRVVDEIYHCMDYEVT